MRPNVLCVVLDAARRDALEPYGAPAGSTPAISQLAARGRAMDDVYSASSWTVPSHAAMFTGLLPRAAGLGQVPDATPFSCRPRMEALDNRVLAGVLRRAGYETRGVSANVWLSEGSGYGTGFDRFVSVDTERHETMHGTSRRARLRWGLEGLRSRADDGAAAAEAVLAGWIAEDRRQPFFWFVNLIECHAPYLPPRPYNDLGPLERLRAARDMRRHYQMYDVWRACVGKLGLPEDTAARVRHLYARSIAYMDDWLARCLDRLDSRGLLGDTLVIVTSDHGENLGEDGLISHAFSLDERLIRVPLISAGPGAFPDRGVTSLAELPRLLADAVGLEDHPWTEDDLPRGVAVAQFDAPGSAGDPRAREAIERWGLDEAALSRLTTSLTCATDGRHKVLRAGSKDVFFELSSEPPYERPVGEDQLPHGSAERLRAAVEHDASGRLVADLPQAEADATATAEELRALEDRMKLLGYM